MTMPARVLLIGDKREHLERKALVLHHFWPIEMALTSEVAPELETEVVVVCSTLPEAERQGWVQRVRQLSPRVLVVKMNGHDSGPFAGADATVDEVNGPGGLVSTIYELLTERGLGSRGWGGDVALRLQ